MARAKLTALVAGMMAATVLESHKEYIAPVTAAKQAAENFVKLGEGVGNEGTELWQSHVLPLVRQAANDEHLTPQDWNSILTDAFDPLTKGRAGANKAASTLKSYISTARTAPFVLRSKYAAGFYKAQQQRVADLIAEGKADEAEKVKYAEPLDLNAKDEDGQPIPVAYSDIRAVMTGASIVATNPLELDADNVIRDIGKACRDYVKANAGKMPEVVETLRAILASIPAKTTAANEPTEDQPQLPGNSEPMPARRTGTEG